jgi:hypothetical protein
MPDVFISYSSKEEGLARIIHQELTTHGVSAFLASLSMPPGAIWPEVILAELRASTWVIVLASKSACQSSFVNQELGGAFFGVKTVVPIVWDVMPADLPGWLSRCQAIDLRKRTVDDLRQEVIALAGAVNQSKSIAIIAFGAVLFGIWAIDRFASANSRAS